MIATLRQRNFALFWGAGLISAAGDWVLLIGLPIYVYVLTRSVAATSITLISGVAPTILLGSVAGVFVDRWNRQRTLVVVNVLLALGLLPLLLVRTASDVWVVYGVAVVETSLEQFLLPAQNALLPAVVGEEHLVPANSLNALSANLARLGGPPLGGLVAGLFGLNGIVGADATSFLVAALALAGMRLKAPIVSSALAPSVAPAGSGIGAFARTWREWGDGVRLIVSQRLLAVLVAVLAFASLGEGFFGALYPVWVYQDLHGGALQIGELMSAQAVGALLASLLVGWIGGRAQSRWVAGLGWISFGVIMVTAAYTPVLLPPAWSVLTGAALPVPIFWVELGLFAAVGIPGLLASTGTLSLLQARSPDAYRGRVFGAEGAIGGVMVLLGALAAATLPEHLGLLPVFSGQGLAKVIAGLVMIALLPAVETAAGRVRGASAPQAAEQPAARAEPAEEVARGHPGE